MKKALVIPARGIGDGLIMMIFSRALREKGYDTVTLHPLLFQMQSWFCQEKIIRDVKETLPDNFFLDYDLIIAENDNSPFIKHLYTLKGKSQSFTLKVLYPTFNADKHLEACKDDIFFDERETMVENVAKSAAHFLAIPYSLDNGLTPPSHTVCKKYLKRALIHPFSSEEKKNWELAKFLELGKRLQKKGYEPVFISEKEERVLSQSTFSYFYGLGLEDILKKIYESGLVIGNDSFTCHAASFFQIPYCVVADCRKRLSLWQPGWGKGACVTLPFPYHLLKVCQKRWQRFTSVPRVLKRVLSLEELS